MDRLTLVAADTEAMNAYERPPARMEMDGEELEEEGEEEADVEDVRGAQVRGSTTTRCTAATVKQCPPPRVGGRKLHIDEREMMTEEELTQVAGRTCANGAGAAVCLHTQQGRKGTNLDAMVVWEVRDIGINAFDS